VLRWTNLALALAGVVSVLLAGVPTMRVLSRWTTRVEDRPGARSGWGDEYADFFGDREQRELEGRLFEILFVPTHLGEEPDQGELRRRIVELGPGVLPLVMGALSGDLVLRPDTPPAGLELAPTVELRPLPDRDVLLVGALLDFDPRLVLDLLDRQVTEQSRVGQRLIAARVLGGLRDPRSLAVLLRIMRQTEPIQFERPHVVAYYEEALAGVLAGRPEGLSELRRDAEGLAPKILPIVVAAVPFQGSSEGAKLVFDLLDLDSSLAPAVLDRISEVAGTLHDAELDDTLWQVHWLVDNPDANIRREAALALGNLQDSTSCPKLIQMLQDSDRRVVGAALWALRNMSERNFAADVQLWLGWYEDERAWFEGPAVELESELRSPDPARVTHAVALLCHHPLFKHRLAATLGPLLLGEDPGTAATACAALGQLGSRRAVPFLVARLEYPEDAVTADVRRTLEVLTGLSLPAAGEAWNEALGL